MSFKLDTGNMLKGISEMELKTKSALGLYADSVAKKMETHAKTNFTWAPRSGRAHQSLNGTWKWIGDKARVELSHGVEYGIWLELCNEKRYAIIKPTIDKISPEAIKGLDKILK